MTSRNCQNRPSCEKRPSVVHPEVEAPVGQHVDRGRLLGEEQRLVPRQHGDRGAEPHGRRPPRQMRENGEGRTDVAPPGEVVLDEEHRFEPELLRLDHLVDEAFVDAAVPGLPGTIAKGPSEQAEPHWPTSILAADPSGTHPGSPLAAGGGRPRKRAARRPSAELRWLAKDSAQKQHSQREPETEGTQG
jgi:hypothetical protein